MNKRIKLIIVDDHQMMRETWKMILQSNPDIEVIAECASGEEAIASADKLLPDIMLMDINMSPVNGFEATQKITSHHPEIKVIGLSINNQPAYARNMLQCGAKGYVTKNSSAREMMQAIEAVLAGNTFICKEVDPASHS